MRLFEAILDANHRALAGDAEAGVRPADFPDELPVAALTCIDPRLNAFFPEVLGLPKEHFIWLRNAGNIITGPMSSTMRSLALGAVVKGAREIAIIGHTDCQVAKTSTAKLTEGFLAMGIDRSRLPDNLTEFFGLFASERQNVIKAVDFVRQSPLIGPKMPVHGLMVDITTGKLDWVVNGYQSLELSTSPQAATIGHSDQPQDAPNQFAAFHMGEMKFPDLQIGEVATGVKPAFMPPPAAARPAQPIPVRYPPPITPVIPVPPRIRGR